MNIILIYYVNVMNIIFKNFLTALGSSREGAIEIATLSCSKEKRSSAVILQKRCSFLKERLRHIETMFLLKL